MSKLNYAVWHTKDGRKVVVGDMDNLHLLHTIRALLEGRLYQDDADTRNKWTTVLQAEAIRRDLDWTVPPSRRINLIAWLHECLSQFLSPQEVSKGIQKCEDVCREAGFTIPELDVSNLNGQVSYLHWMTGEGVGTPIKEKKVFQKGDNVRITSQKPEDTQHLWIDEMDRLVGTTGEICSSADEHGDYCVMCNNNLNAYWFHPEWLTKVN